MSNLLCGRTKARCGLTVGFLPYRKGEKVSERAREGAEAAKDKAQVGKEKAQGGKGKAQER
jgi:hypothetical protein